jgi:putative zinc finger/helix-turn-helix YgiT family protein
MTDKMICPLCASMGTIDISERDETVEIKRKKIVFRAIFSRCTRCGGEFETPEQMDANLTAAREIYSALYEAPTPDEIRALRSLYGASQKAFAILLGLGELTINSYEQGAVPAEPNRTILRLVRDPCVFRRLYNLNKSKIGALQRKRIEESPGFAAGEKWIGLESLKRELPESDSSCLEKVAESLGQSLGSWCASVLIPCAQRSRMTILPPLAWAAREWMHIGSSSLHTDAEELPEEMRA